MKKLLKKFSIIAIFIISLGFCSTMMVFSEPPVTENTVQQVTENTQTLDEIPDSIPEKNYENLKKIKNSVTTSKTFLSMITFLILGVTGLIFIAFFRFYKKLKNNKQIVSAPLKETLETPKDFKTAINLFLGKTDE